MSTTMKTVPATRSTPASSNEAQIRQMISAWSRALEAKDVDGLTKDYAPDAVLFDVKPPHKVTGPAAIRQLWAECIPFFPAKFKSEHRDLHFVVGDDVAIVYGLHHIQPIDPPIHPAGQCWIRVTACYKKVDGRWLVAHEHVSMPFDCATGQIAPITNPDA